MLAIELCILYLLFLNVPNNNQKIKADLYALILINTDGLTKEHVDFLHPFSSVITYEMVNADPYDIECSIQEFNMIENITTINPKDFYSIICSFPLFSEEILFNDIISTMCK
jgi:hypothetical protein